MNKIRLNIDIIIRSRVLTLLLLSCMIMTGSIASYSQTSPLVNINNGAKVNFANGSTVVINGSLLNASGATLNLNGEIRIYGNWTNNGTQTASSTSHIEFLGSENAEISGSGSTQFYRILVNKDTREVILRLNTALASTTPSGFMELRRGSFRVIGNYAFSNKFFVPIDNEISIPGTAEFWLENQNAVVEGQLANLILEGLLKISNGVFNAGSAIEYKSTPSKQAELEIENGTLNVGQSIASLGATPNSHEIKYTQSGGSVNLATAAPISATKSVFEITNPNSIVNISAGEIVLKNENNTANVDDYSVQVDNKTITGGTLKIDAAAAGQTFSINSGIPVGNLLMTGTNNPIVQLTGNNLSVIKDVTIAGAGTGRMKLNGFDLSLGGDWNHDIANVDGLDQGEKSIIFVGNQIQNIKSTTIDPVFNGRFVNNKNGEKIVMQRPMTVNGPLKLVGSPALIDMKSNNLTIGPTARFYADMDENYFTISSFGQLKHVVNSGSDTNALEGAWLIRKLPTDLGLPAFISFPLGTASGFSPAQVDLLSGGTALGANPEIRVKVVPMEHPGVETPNKSLKKFWNVKTQDVTLSNNKTRLIFYYAPADAGGSEGYYRVAKYEPSWNAPNALWKSDPGTLMNLVDFSLKIINSDGLNNIDGDWTAAQIEAISGYYYSRADGDYNDRNTWSKQGFGGTASATYPNKSSDQVFIQGHTVTITGAVSKAKLIAVQTGIDGRTDGVLKIRGNNFVDGDTFKLEPKAKLYIGSALGVSEAPSPTGSIRSTNRLLSEDAYYCYWGDMIADLDQVTGAGLPNRVAKIFIEKTTPTTKVALSKNILIKESFHIENGAFDMASYTLNGEAGNRTFTMNGGEFIVRSAFPSNYTPPTFTKGKVTFDGTGNITIPSTGSAPGVAQYNDLTISSTSRTGNVIISRDGEVKIGHNLDISQMNFANNSYKFFTDGSTVRYNSPTIDQNIQFTPQSPADVSCYLNYYNLIMAGAGKAKITGSNASAKFKILKNLTLENNANFDANNFNIDLHGDWRNLSGKFVQGTGTVNLISDVATIPNHIISRSTVDNPFNNVRITGPGITQIEDNILINGNLYIDTTATFRAQNYTVELKGNWTSKGATFAADNSTVLLNGTNQQNIVKTSGNETFNNLTINNAKHVNAYQVGGDTSGVIINGNLVLNAGNLISHNANAYRYVQLTGNLTRPGLGFVDGELRKKIGLGASTVVFEVGYNKAYTPVTLDFTGTGGSQGFLGVISDTINTTTNPIKWNDFPATDFTPLKSLIDPGTHIARRYGVTIPNGSTFALTNSRRYNAKVQFVSGDLKGANTQNFTMSLLKNPTTPEWVYPFSYEYLVSPIITEKTINTTKMDMLKDFGNLMVGNPAILTYYTRKNGNWNDRTNWSLEEYAGLEAPTYPGQNGNNVYIAYIGNGNEIKLTGDITVTKSNAPLTNNATIIVDSTNGAGKLVMGQNVIRGNGEFRLMARGTLSIGHTGGIAKAGENTGNVQTTVRNYNYNRHQRGIFIYTGAYDASTGSGLPNANANDAIPDTVYKLIVDKAQGFKLTQWGQAGDGWSNNSMLHILDTFWVKNGTYELSTANWGDLLLYGDMIFNPRTSMILNTRSVWFRGDRPQYIQGPGSNQTINFEMLNIQKKKNSGNIILKENTNIYAARIVFAGVTANNPYKENNNVIIDATSYSDTNNPNYVSYANIDNARQYADGVNGGWIWGHVRRNVPAGNTTVRFETGTSRHYAPFELNFIGGGGTAGGLQGATVEGIHPKLDAGSLENYPINEGRQFTAYWKLIKPAGSAFAVGGRSYNVTTYYNNPAHTPNVDCGGCSDLAFYRGGEINNSYSNNQWQGLFAKNTGFNSTVEANAVDADNLGCHDTRKSRNIPANLKFNYGGYSCYDTTPLGFITVKGITQTVAPFGTTNIGTTSNTLLADFVAGNRNTIKYYTFYSIKDGDWSDPTTWSTEGYNSTVNAAIADSGDVDVRPVPSRQFDRVFIGNGKKVRVDMIVGGNEADAAMGPGVTVENTGTLDFGTTSLRGVAFKADPGATLVIGAEDGLQKQGTDAIGWKGNLQLSTNAANISDSISMVYSPRGKTVNVRKIVGLAINPADHYITAVEFKDSVNNSVLKYESRDKYRSTNPKLFFAPASMNVVPGGRYTVIVNSNSTHPKHFIVQILNYDGTWTQLNKVSYPTANSGGVGTVPITIPVAFGNGSTLLRVITATNDNLSSSSYGEAEMYTIHTTKPDYIAHQVPGTGMPSVLKSFTVTSSISKPWLSSLTLNKKITVVDTMKLELTRLFNGANQIDIAGDIINHNTYTFQAGTGKVTFLGDKPTRIFGNAKITFNDVTLLKKNDYIPVYTHVGINGKLTIDSLNTCILADRKILTFGPTATITGLQLGKKVMVKVSGSDSSGVVTKEFLGGPAGTSYNFTFPVGVDTTYNPAKINLTATFQDTASVSVRLIKKQHPNRLNDDILKKYWKLTTNKISNVTASRFEFLYVNADTAGDINRYIPARYNNGWEIDLGTNPLGKPDKILIQNEPGIQGDWTTGVPTTYFPGRIFYSRGTGSWDERLNWSTDQTLKHTGKAAAYYPGELYKSDTVNIDGHNITLSTPQKIEIDSLRMGGTNGTAGDVANLYFANSIANSLTARSIFMDNDKVNISSLDNNSGIDTILISKYFINNSTGTGFDGYKTETSKIALKFIGSGNSEINGTGAFPTISDIILKKDGGLADSLVINSDSFVAGSNAAMRGAITPQSGVLKSNSDNQFVISAPNKDIYMGMYSGIDCVKNITFLKGNLTTNTNTTLNMNGGNLVIGNSANKHLIYQTGTKISLLNGQLQVSGAISRLNENATMELEITNNANNVLYVNAVGNTDPNKIGLDISNAGSSVSISGGLIMIVNAGGTTNSPFDLRINAMGGTGITGGTIFSGHPSSTPNNTTIKIGGMTPLYNLTFANGESTRNLTTYIHEQTMTVKNNWTVGNNHIANLNGNTLKLGGNLTASSTIIGRPTTWDDNPWMLELNGTGDQLIDNRVIEPNYNLQGIKLLNLKINKLSGKVNLGANTLLKVARSLEFTAENQAIISTGSPTMSSAVILEPMQVVGGAGDPTVYRSGLGHVDGYCGIEFFEQGAYVNFPIGGNTAALYRPLEFQQTQAANGAGILMAKFINEDHPDIANAGIIQSTNLQKYWVLTPHTQKTYQLPLGGKYNLNVHYDKTVDFRPTTDEFELDQIMRTPMYGTAGPATWEALNTLERQTNISRSFENTNFGDVILAVLSGTTFYSINNGNWNDPANWSTDSYTGSAAARFPNLNTDIVKIGNGKKITVPTTLDKPEVRSVVVEKFNNLPGELQINGKLNGIQGRSFTLRDSCTLGMENQSGINTVIEGARGAVLTRSRNFGESRYIFNSPLGSQISGNALPNKIKTLIVDNSATNGKTLFLHNTPGLTELKITDTLAITQGAFNTSDRDINIHNTMRVDSVVNDGVFYPGMAKVSFSGGGNKYIDLANNGGIRFNRLELDNSSVIAEHKTRRNTTLEHLYVQDNLNFIGSNVHLILGDSVNIKIENTIPVSSITGAGPANFILTSNNSGMLIRRVARGYSYEFPIGSRENNNIMYAPATLSLDREGVTGSIGVRTSWGSNSKGGHKYLVGTPEAGYLKRYWAVDSVTMQIKGTLSFTYNDDDFLTGFNENNITKIGRWRPAREISGGSWTHPSPITQLAKERNQFVTDRNGTYTDLAGDWTLGNDRAFRRIFYSRQNGNWSNSDSWTFNDTFTGESVGAGIFPNAAMDSVVIGNFKTITLDINNPFADPAGVGIRVGKNIASIGKLKLGTNVLNGDYFDMIESSQLYIGAPEGISALGTNTGNIQTTKSRNFSNSGIYSYIGTTNQVIGSGLPSTSWGIEVNNTGVEGQNTVMIDRNLTVRMMLSITKGVLDILDHTINATDNNSSCTLLYGTTLRIGGTNNPTVSIPGFTAYTLDANSTVEFYGDNQDFSKVPVNLYDPANHDNIKGYGNVLHSNGSSILMNSILIKGNLTNNATATITVDEDVNSIQVRKSVINNGTLTNKGKIEIGQCN